MERNVTKSLRPEELLEAALRKLAASRPIGLRAAVLGPDSVAQPSLLSARLPRTTR